MGPCTGRAPTLRRHATGLLEEQKSVGDPSDACHFVFPIAPPSPPPQALAVHAPVQVGVVPALLALPVWHKEAADS